MHMPLGDPTALDLRFRERDFLSDGPPVDAFGPPAIASRIEDDEIAVFSAQAREEALLLFFQTTQFGIPAPGPSSLDLASWSLRPTTFGVLASVPAPSVRTPSQARRTWLVAACMPFLWPLAAEAAEPSQSPPIQRPRDETPPAATQGESEATPPPSPPELPAESNPSAASPVDPAVTEAPPEASSAAPKPPRANASATKASPPASPFDVDPRVVDAAWEGVVGLQVDLQLKGGLARQGKLTAVQRETFTLIESPTGRVLVMSKASVDSLRVRMPPPIPTSTGTGLLAGGGVMLSIATPVFITGAVFLGICPSCIELHVPMLMTGIVGLAGGIPMLIYGTRRRRAYAKVVEQYQLVPHVAWTRNEWTGGVRFRF